MKTSKLLLLLTLIATVGLFLAGMFVLKKDIQHFTDTKEKQEGAFSEISLDNFEKIVVNGAWKVKISEGLDNKVYMTRIKDSAGTKAIVTDGTLFLTNTGTIQAQAKINVHTLRQLVAERGATIAVGKLPSDSLYVILNDNCKFIGKRSNETALSFRTSGDVSIELDGTKW